MDPMNKVVARMQDGTLLKGVTSDFSPMKDAFHIAEVVDGLSQAPIPVWTKDLKAVFFVKSLEGNPAYRESKDFSRPPVGRAVRVLFNDGEVMVGTTNGYKPNRPGFFLVPADPDSNNERCYVVMSAVREVRPFAPTL